MLSRGLIPTVRVLISNPGPGRVRIPRSWTYEVIPQASVSDERIRGLVTAPADDDRHYSPSELAFLPEQRVWMTLSENNLFGRSGQDPIVLAGQKSWGHDHSVDLRLAQMKPGPIFIRLSLTLAGPHSDWQRLSMPDVPDLPLIRFTKDTRKLLGEAPFARAVKTAGCSFVATIVTNDQPWTRVMTVDPHDPLAALIPKLLLDGRSATILEDKVPYRFAVRGISAEGHVESDAEVIAIQPVE